MTRPPTPTASPTGSCIIRLAPKPTPSIPSSSRSLALTGPPASCPRATPTRTTWGRPSHEPSQHRHHLPSPTGPSASRGSRGGSGGAATRDPGPRGVPLPSPVAPPEEESTPHDRPLRTQAQALVDAFHQRFHGRAPGTAHPKELAHATQLLTEHGATKAHFLLTYAQQAAPETAYQPKFFGGILPYLPEALAAYDAQARQAAQRRTQQAAAREQRCHERYLAWQQEQCAQLRAALPSTALMALEDAQRARLRAAGTALVALDIAVRVAIDNVLAAQAQLPTFEVWRQQEAAC